MRETNIQKLIMLAVSKAGTKIFRNNTGKAWIGESEVIRKPGVRYLDKGDVVVKNARRFHAGLCKGSSDLIGWTPREISPNDVGKIIAVFTALEIKTKSGRLRSDQSNFLQLLEQAGGIAVVARSEEEALAAIEKAF